MRILHLGFEEHRRPGAGGGGLRNYEINRRLARDHEVTIVVASYPGCSDRVEDGVQYRHVGTGQSYFPSILSYFACIPWVVAKGRAQRSYDLIVEDFAPPFATLGVPAWSGLPTCGNVQWFYAAEKSAEFGLPAWPMETMQRWGTRRYTHLVAMSEGLATQLRSINAAAEILVNGLGVAPPDVGKLARPVPRSSVFVGRLDVEIKGLDLLLDALAILPHGFTELTIVGDGRGRRKVEEQIRRLGLNESVRLLGDVRGDAKWRLLAEAQLIVMPSRGETFGLTALEALSVGRPVLAFDIPNLRSIVTEERGVLVEPFDVSSFAEAWARLLKDPDECDRLGCAGSRYARDQSWDAVAERQEAFYIRCVEDSRS
jgi:glycosyltransferase involved in cell wall biosynthesis